MSAPKTSWTCTVYYVSCSYNTRKYSWVLAKTSALCCQTSPLNALSRGARGPPTLASDLHCIAVWEK